MLPETAYLFTPVLDLATQLVGGDLALRELSLAETAYGRQQPYLLAARRLQVDFKFTYNVADHHFLPWWNKDWTAASVDLSLALEPSRALPDDPPTRPEAAETPAPPQPLPRPSITLVPPGMLVNPGRPAPSDRSGLFQLRCGAASWLWVEVDDDGLHTEWTKVGDSVPTKVRSLIKDWTGIQFCDFLTALEEWHKEDPGEPPQPYLFPEESLTPLAAGEIPPGDRVFQGLAEGYATLLAALCNGVWNVDQRDLPPQTASLQELQDRQEKLRKRREDLRKAHPDLVGDYRIASLGGRSEFWLTWKGQLATTEKAAKDGTKMAFDLQYTSHPGLDELRIDPYPSDLIVSGPLHARLIEAMKELREKESPLIQGEDRGADLPFKPEADFAHAVTKENKNLFQREKEDDHQRLARLRDFFQGGSYAAQTTFIRVQRYSATEDYELAVVRGEVLPGKPALLVFQMQWKPPAGENPAVTSAGSHEFSDITFIAGHDGQGRFYPEEGKEVKLPGETNRYIKGILRSLSAWNEALRVAAQRDLP